MSILRRLGATAKISLWWTAAWVTLILLAGLFLRIRGYHQPISFLLRLALTSAVAGLVAGSTFAGLIAWTEAHKTVGQLKSWRMALWGGIATLVVPCVKWLLGLETTLIAAHAGVFMFGVGFCALAGATLAVAITKAARRGDRLEPPPESPLLPGSEPRSQRG